MSLLEGTIVDGETGEELTLGRSSNVDQETKYGEDEDSAKAREQKAKAERKKALLGLQRRQAEQLEQIVMEEIEAEKAREAKWRLEATNPSARRFLTAKFQRERAQARERIERIKHENELVLVAKMSELNLIR